MCQSLEEYQAWSLGQYMLVCVNIVPSYNVSYLKLTLRQQSQLQISNKGQIVTW